MKDLWVMLCAPLAGGAFAALLAWPFGALPIAPESEEHELGKDKVQQLELPSEMATEASREGVDVEVEMVE